MSYSKESFIVLDDDEEDNVIVDSPQITTRDSKLSFSQTRGTAGRHLVTKTKSLPSKTSSKTTSSKRQKSWISSSFDGFGGVASFDDEPKKRKTKQTSLTTTEGFSSQPVKSSQPANKEISTNLWIDKYQPKTEAELAVHKKKIEDVRSWLLDRLSTKSSDLLLLTGPVGTGKTATITALSKELDFEVQEWINPMEGFTFGNDYAQSQLSQFKDFLLRSNKYPTLSIFAANNTQKTHGKVILLEDLPNLFYRDAKMLHEILMEYRQKGRCPLVLIISDSRQDDANVHKLLPKAMHTTLGLSTISFNPVANTSILKTLNRIVSLESKMAGKDFSMPSKDVINELAQSCAGDIRTAINALQFSCQKGIQDSIVSKYKSSKLSASKTQNKETSRKTQKSQFKKSAGKVLSSKGEKEEEVSVKAIGGKDTTLFLFRALGKILYCKRDVSQSDKDLLPSQMSHLARNVPQFCPEDVVERAHLSSELLSLYLHQNYLDFFTDMDDVVLASEYVSDANMMSMEWMHRSSLIPYMSCIATRGLMYSNNQHAGTNSVPSRGGWRPLHKPQWFDVNKKARVNSRIAKELFQEQTCTNAVLHTQIIPYLAITDVPLKTPGQISFIEQMGRYQKTKSTFRSHTDTLDEKDCGGSDGEDEPTDSQSCQQSNSVAMSQRLSKNQDSQEIASELDEKTDKDVVIEDFDDE